MTVWAIITLVGYAGLLRLLPFCVSFETRLWAGPGRACNALWKSLGSHWGCLGELLAAVWDPQGYLGTPLDLHRVLAPRPGGFWMGSGMFLEMSWMYYAGRNTPEAHINPNESR